ncbi:tumor necrosis factor receptor superfamily member 13B [Xiphias gladius]|uniref:tumor necrosis factor receptor superfamily member 13B n=1 Tax=Xiphias gladius TaxID=8245 RepID=UPI001A992453|nr:tumor necrosis factor receptor superfamily member 13B [Xiphias gladius]
MGGSCPEGQYLDTLVKECLYCHLVCQQPHVITKCISYCEAAYCKALPGHYYDGLLKKCLRCAEVCGRHPAECSQHCQTLPLPGTTEKLLVDVTSHTLNSRGLSVPIDSSVFLYSLLALCMVLLFSSLSLALVVFLRGPRTKTSNPGPKEANHIQERVVQPGQEVGLPGGQLGQSSKDFVQSSSCPTDREPSDDSSPTETCVCIHCFPDLKALGQGNDRLLRAPLTFYQQADPLRAQIQKGGPRTEENLYTSELQGPGAGSSEMRSIYSVSNQSV